MRQTTTGNREFSVERCFDPPGSIESITTDGISLEADDQL
jgi:hypothetical protein